MTLTQDLPLLLPITALLPLTAILLVAQGNPYQTLVLRGLLGAVSALIYALLGAADVALTEALVGTLLSTTLYAVALRSSMVLRVAVATELPVEPPAELMREQLRRWIDPLHLRLELLRPVDPDLHAVLEPTANGSFRLLLHNRQLLERLAALPGSQAWRQAGHQLVYRELQPMPPAAAMPPTEESPR
jgi:putative multicomponent Na+:H+ antiporter subunit B